MVYLQGGILITLGSLVFMAEKIDQTPPIPKSKPLVNNQQQKSEPDVIDRAKKFFTEIGYEFDTFMVNTKNKIEEIKNIVPTRSSNEHDMGNTSKSNYASVTMNDVKAQSNLPTANNGNKQSNNIV